MGRCVLDVIDAANRAGARSQSPPFEVVGIVDDGSPDTDKLRAHGVEHLGPISILHDLPADVGYLIGIAAPGVRRAIDRDFRAAGRPSPVLVHPNAHIGRAVEIGPGAIVCSHVSIESHARVGRHVHLNQNSTVGHDSTLGDHCTISPLVALSGNVTMEVEVFVGTGASIRQGLTLGTGSVVGMGAAVVRDVGAGRTVVGVPASAR